MGLKRKRRNMFWKSNLQNHEDHARQKPIQTIEGKEMRK